MKRIFCILSGGHRYDADDVKIRYDNENERVYVTMKCRKCGMIDSFPMMYNDVFDITKRRERNETV